jgi:hypothetical protein
MNINTKDILSSRWILYIVSFLSLTSVFGYLMNNDYAPILFFVLVAFLTNYFSKNMIIVLGIALIATNLLAGITNVFGVQSLVSKKEGNENMCSATDKTTCDDVSGCEWDGSDSKCSIAAATLNIGPTTTINDAKNAQATEMEMDDLESLLNNDTIRNMTSETNSLMQQQGDLMQQMKDIGPLVNEAMGALKNLGSGNMVDMFSSLSGSLGKFKDKYPDAFPANYDEKTAQINELIVQAKELNKQNKNAGKAPNTNENAS